MTITNKTMTESTRLRLIVDGVFFMTTQRDIIMGDVFEFVREFAALDKPCIGYCVRHNGRNMQVDIQQRRRRSTVAQG